MSSFSRPSVDPPVIKSSPPDPEKVLTRCRCGNVSVLTEEPQSDKDEEQEGQREKGWGLYIVSVFVGFGLWSGGSIAG